MIGSASTICLWAGVHRMWSHNAFKAHWSVRLALALGFTSTVNGTIYEWCRGHRVHHKHADTDGDPNNAKRGIFFSHFGWFWRTEHPDVARADALYNYDHYLLDWVVRWQHDNYWWLHLVTNGAIILMHHFLCGDSLFEGLIFTICRVIQISHSSSLINSAAHLFGHRPYNKSIMPTNNVFVSIATLGDGYHNYHHQFPFDYRQSETSHNAFNFSALLIDTLAWLGLAWDLRTVSPAMIGKSRQKMDIILNNNVKLSTDSYTHSL